ncbi:MAG TPA: monofunctional biosynthetic peptidoglycan transglycosylase [bacterium]|nr:monofunctional biosynthetic peptidoglycan transglycosylase [bacterium]
MSTLRKLFVFALMTPLIALGGFFVFTLPPVACLRFSYPVRTAMMLLKPGPVDQRWVPMKDIAPSLGSAVVNAEDATFYEHHGVDFKQMREAMEKNRKKKRFARGGSTITMQLAKNLYLTPRKLVFRKVLEIALAYEMEVLLSKDRILELYLNLIEWAPGVYGAQSAAGHYFRKPASKLTSAEAAFLAAIIPSPKKWGRWPPGPYIQGRMQHL